MNTWLENPCWQFFTGGDDLQTELPIDPSSLTRWSMCIGEEGVETLLALTIEAARKAGMISKSRVERVTVDTTVMPKAIAHPIDGRLLERARKHRVKLAEDGGITPRQNDNCEAPRLATQVGRYAHVKQYKRMHKTLRTLRGRVGRVHREDRAQGACAARHPPSGSVFDWNQQPSHHLACASPSSAPRPSMNGSAMGVVEFESIA